MRFDNMGINDIWDETKAAGRRLSKHLNLTSQNVVWQRFLVESTIGKLAVKKI